MHAANPSTSSDPIDISWGAIEAVTVEMKESAETLDWLTVVEQAARRHNLVLAHFEQFPVGPQNADFYRDRLSAMLTGEQALQELVREARKTLMSEGAAMQLNKRMVSAYRNASLG